MRFFSGVKNKEGHENMKTKKTRSELSRGLLTRLVLAVLLLVTLGSVLTSCGGRGGQKITTIKKTGEITISEEAKAEHGLTAEQLNKLADTIAEHKQGFTIRTQLIAALNGYDMNAAGFDDSKIARPGETLEGAIEAQPDKAPEYAITALKKAEIETFPYVKDDTVLMTRADVQSLVDCFKLKVAADAELGALDQVLHWIGLGFEWLITVPGFGSFILGTLYFAIALELLMLPLGIRQQNNSRKQARLRPKEMAIRGKYKGRNDQATMMKLNQEIQELYTKEGYSPMAGCLPLLLTLPVLMLLYYIVLDPLTYMMGASGDLTNAFLTFADAPRAAGGLGITTGRGTIEVLAQVREYGISLDGLADFAYFSNGQDCLSALDGLVDRIPDFTLFGISLGQRPSDRLLPLVLVPILNFVVYWATGKITRKLTFQPMQQSQDPAQGCSNGIMNIMMPAMSAFFTLTLPAAIGVYWIFKSLVGLLKQFILYKAMPMPTFTEEEYKAAERELAGKDKAKPVKKSGTRNPNVRSLHHIDDEDYDTSTQAPARKKGAAKPDYVEPEEEPEKPRTAEGVYGDGATLKEDRPARPEGDRKKKKKKQETEAADEPDFSLDPEPSTDPVESDETPASADDTRTDAPDQE